MNRVSASPVPLLLASFFLATTAGIANTACTHAADYYCDENTPCADRYPDRPFCDLTGEYPASEGIGKTCIPDPFGADAGVPDAGAPDSGFDALVADADPFKPDAEPGTPPDPPIARSPINGQRTGSPFATSPGLANPPLRPTFHWETSPTATRYEIQIDDSCSAADFEACPFPSPEVDDSTTQTSYAVGSALAVSTSAPVGRRYFWRVRACIATSCSEWTPIRYLDVGRLWSDFNGDGYADIIAGAPQQTATDAGAAYVFAGASSGVAETPTRVLAHPDTQSNAAFGYTVAAVGDINADGYGDAVVAAPLQDISGTADRGRVYVYHGSSAGLSETPARELDGPLAGPLEFGETVSAGDLNGDGRDDVVITGVERAYVFYGSNSGLPATPSQSLQQSGAESFAHSTAIGDFNADGYADLAIGAPGISSGEADLGRFFTYHGASPTLLDDPTVVLPPDIAGTGHTGSDFGVELAAVPDSNADGFEDLAVSYDISDSWGSSITFLYFGTQEEFEVTPLQIAVGWVASLAGARNLNGDGYGDFLIGWWYYTGVVLPSPRLYAAWGGATPNTSASSLAGKGDVDVGAGDLNGDGFDDVVAGLTGSDDGEENEGRIGLLYGSISGIEAIPSVFLDNPDDEVDGHFGASAAAGR